MSANQRLFEERHMQLAHVGDAFAAAHTIGKQQPDQQAD